MITSVRRPPPGRCRFRIVERPIGRGCCVHAPTAGKGGEAGCQLGPLEHVIIRGGENIPVAYVEDVLYEHPDVDALAVVGIPAPRLQERACACVVLKAGAPEMTFGAMQEFLATKGIAKQYWPRSSSSSTVPEDPRRHD